MERNLELGRIWYSSFSQSGLLPLFTDAYSKKEINQFKFSKEFQDLIDDPQHFKAMRECFGSDEQARAVFFWGTYAADISGKFAAWAADALLIRLLWYGGQAVWAAGAVEMPQRYMWFRVIMRIANRDRTLIRKLGNPFILVALIGGLASELVGNRRLHERIILDQAEAKNEGLQQSLRDLELLQALLSKTKDPSEKHVIKVMIDKQISLIESQRGQIRKSKSASAS